MEAYFATKVLDTTKSTGFSCNCALLGSLFKGASSNLEIYYGVATSKACGCGLEASSEAKLAVFEGLKSDLLVEVAGAAMLWYELMFIARIALITLTFHKSLHPILSHQSYLSQHTTYIYIFSRLYAYCCAL